MTSAGQLAGSTAPASRVQIEFAARARRSARVKLHARPLPGRQVAHSACAGAQSDAAARSLRARLALAKAANSRVQIARNLQSAGEQADSQQLLQVDAAERERERAARAAADAGAPPPPPPPQPLEKLRARDFQFSSLHAQANSLGGAPRHNSSASAASAATGSAPRASSLTRRPCHELDFGGFLFASGRRAGVSRRRARRANPAWLG